MAYSPILLLLNAVINTLIGISVIAANHKRTQNRAFLVWNVLNTIWSFTVLAILTSDTPEDAAFFIRLATFVSTGLAFAFHMLCIAIAYPERGMRHAISRTRYIFLTTAVAGVLCWLPNFLLDVKMLSITGVDVAEPTYGPLFAVNGILFTGMLLYSFVSSIKRMKHLPDEQRNEFQFVLLGVGVMATLGLLIQFIVPQFTGIYNVAQYNPLTVTLMNLIVAYGIATKQILEVASVLRTIIAHTLLVVYLVAIYSLVYFASNFVQQAIDMTAWPVAHVMAAIVVAYSVAPAHGLFQNFAMRLFRNLSRLNLSSMLKELNELLQGIYTIDHLFSEFVRVVSDSVGTDQVVIYLYASDRLDQSYPLIETGPINSLDADNPICLHFKQHSAPLHVTTLRRVSTRGSSELLIDSLQKQKAELAVAIKTGQHVTGVLIFGRKVSGRIYKQDEIAALQLLGQQLGTAIENAEMYTETQNSKIYNEMLLDNMVGGVVAVSTERQITVFNAEAQRILGKTSEEMLNRSISVLPSDLGGLLDETLTRKAGVRDVDYFLPSDKLDVETPIRVSSALFHGHDDSELGALLIINDLTAIRKLEEQLRMNDRLASIGTLSAGMAHEIKNPLVSIKTFAQLLPERYQDDDFRNTFSQIIGDEITRIDSIVNKLLSFARPTKPALTPMHLFAVLDKTTILVQQQLKTTDVHLQLDLNASDDLILGDKDQLEQVFLNFILNAVDSMINGGTLTVRTENLNETTHWRGTTETSSKVRVSISDTGQGIAKENIPHVFDPFFTTKSKGTGLGLSVSHGIIEEHHATVEIESEIGQGTTFHITFPVVMQEATV